MKPAGEVFWEKHLRDDAYDGLNDFDRRIQLPPPLPRSKIRFAIKVSLLVLYVTESSIGKEIVLYSAETSWRSEID
jgi:hypothetical protein